MLTRYFSRFLPGLVLLLLWPAWSARAQVSGISYTLTPSIEHLAFEDQAGLDDTQLYGGRLGFSFGEYVELSGLYLFNDNARTRLDGLSVLQDLTTDLDLSLLQRDVALKRYGGQLKFNLGSGLIHPYLVGGTGILRLEPDNLEKSETIYLSGGAGLQYGLDRRYTFLLQVEALSYRHNVANLLSEADLSDLGLAPGDLNNDRKTNLSVRAGLQVYLGGRRPGEMTEVDRAFQRQFSGGLRSLRLQVAPFWGQIEFDADLGFRKNQRMAGVFAGLDFGPYVGVRGFYWRGVQDGEIARFEDLQAYGGEMTLTFAGAGNSLSPYLSIGAGIMDVFGDYHGNLSVVPEDQTFALLGAGVSLPLGETIRLHGNVRSLLMSSLDAEEVSDPNQVQASFMYSAGISFGLGRRAPTGGRLIESELEQNRREAMTAQERMAADLAARERALQKTEARLDSLAALLMTARQGNPAAMTQLQAELRRDSLQASPRPGGPQDVGPEATRPVGHTAGDAETPWVSLPVPREGEIYVRYGRPGGVSVESLTGDAVVVDPVTGAFMAAPSDADASSETFAGLSAAQLQAIVQQAVRAEMARALPRPDSGATPMIDAALLDQMTRRFEARLAEMERRLESRLQETAPLPAPSSPPPTVVVEQEPLASGSGLQAIYPLTGFNLSNPQQVLLGLRADLRNPSTGSMRLLPELVLGYGEENTRALNVNVAYPLRWSLFGDYEPYAGAGLGFLSGGRLEAVLNLLVGVERTFGVGSFFGELMTLDFFDQNRLLIGYRVRF